MPLNVTFDCNLNGRSPINNRQSADYSTASLTNDDAVCTVKLTSFTQNSKRRISMPPKNCSAVEVRRLRYSVGRGRKTKVILSGINMTVPEGAIYGLLGPSGSGKTTLLKSVVGQITPNEGYVKVFGFQPNKPGSQIPGPAVGYMPQELALYEDFTIKEILWYFGRLYKVPRETIKERIEFLLSFLDLPSHKRLVLNLSGGQKRRVSLASALVHSPPLLILDEPTVGVDPLLRQSIWKHLVTLTQTEKITVIVTTHYIEEASRANIVGLMRRGRLLAENNPADLLAKHKSASLEDVFLKLCVTDTMRRSTELATVAPSQLTMKIVSINGNVDNNNSSNNNNVDNKQRNGSPLSTTSSASPSASSASNQSTGVVDSDGGTTFEAASVENSITTTSNETATTTNDEQKLTNDDSNNLDVINNSSKLQQQFNGKDNNLLPLQLPSIQSSGNNNSNSNNNLGLKLHKRIKSILRINSNNNAELNRNIINNFGTNNENDIEDNDNNNVHSNSKLCNQPKENQRRQSGAHFIQQLMNELQDQNIKQQHQGTTIDIINSQQQQNKSINQNLNSMLTCKTDSDIVVKSALSKDELATTLTTIAVSNKEDDLLIKANELQVVGGGGGNDTSLLGTITKSQKQLNNGSSYFNQSFDPSSEICCNTYRSPKLNYANSHKTLNSMNKTSSNNIDDNNLIVSAKTSILDKNCQLELDPELFLDPQELSTMSPGLRFDYRRESFADYCDSIKTITWKNYTRLKRNKPLLLFQFLLPAIQVVLFCICVGNDPFDIPVAVVNEESSADSFAALSSKFLQAIDTKLARLVNYNDLPTAIQSVRDGKNWGVIHIPENFTISLHRRFSGFEENLDDNSLVNSTIRVYPDMTSQPIGHAMEVAFRKAYSTLAKATVDFLGLNPGLAEPPIKMEDAIYGQLHMQNYLQYMSAGILISISYIMATGLTSLAFIIERRDGSYDRTLAAGVGQIQMLLSHAIVQLVVMIAQISLVVFCTFVVYKVPTNGPFHWVFVLLLLQGLAGMSFGLMVSSICTEENTAIMMILGTFYPNLLLAGVIWPIEAIPYWLRWFSYLQPQTLPTQSLRDLIVRGWGIEKPGVYQGFIVTSIWLLVFLLISCISFRIKK